MRQELDAAQRQEEARAGKLILIALALIVALLQVVWLVRAAAKRRWERMRERIGCDLHDELGANVSSIAHMAELLSETIEKPTEQQTRLLTSLLKNARLTSREARQLVRLVKADDYRTVLEAIQLGVVGYILKDTPIAELRRAIFEVHEGGSIIDPQLSRLVLKAFNEKDAGVESPLSERERQVLELLAMGYVKKEVADGLGISYSAVALYTANIYEKLQVPNIAAAVAAAIRKGLI